MARDLCNEPSNVLTPSVFADRAAAIGRSAGLGVQILDEEELARLRMGLLLGVARGSAEPPRMIVLRHEPAGATGPVLGLVGKGITFDTGGISIKPADGMEKMKDDMAGGAAVVCAMRAIALLQAPIRVIGIVPAAENMPGSRAIKPGDVLTGGGGKTVEVINTDAEGRLILGDGLWYAQQLGATHLVDVATLTGACVVALGRAASGLFGQPDAWVEIIRAVGLRAGDRCWPMPLFDEYADQLRSEIADMMNVGGRPAGACTAAMFLKEFAGGLPWAHLDVAGTAWIDDAKPWAGEGADRGRGQDADRAGLYQRRLALGPVLAPTAVRRGLSEGRLGLLARGFRTPDPGSREEVQRVCTTAVQPDHGARRRAAGRVHDRHRHPGRVDGLTGALLLAALVLGLVLGGVLIGVKVLRSRLDLDPPADSLRVTPGA